MKKNIKELTAKEESQITGEPEKDILERLKKQEQMMIEKENLERKLILLQINQTKLIKKQTLFNEILAVATVVLAFGFILTFFKITLTWENNGFILFLLILVTILFIIFIIILTCKAIEYIGKLDKRYWNWRINYPKNELCNFIFFC